MSGIFISWSGPKSLKIAQVFRKYIPIIIGPVDVFMSKTDIASGAVWTQTLRVELAKAHFGLVCFTETNASAPWITYEAGALFRLPEGAVCGLLTEGMSLSDIIGPLAQFQHRYFTKDDVHQLFLDINKTLENPREHSHLTIYF